jgi:hypothetical protein
MEFAVNKLQTQICLDFLKSAQFKVRGTSRKHKDEAKLAPIRKAFREFFDNFELVSADLLDAQLFTRRLRKQLMLCRLLHQS